MLQIVLPRTKGYQASCGADRTAHELHTRLSRDYEPSVVEEVLAYLEDRAISMMGGLPVTT